MTWQRAAAMLASIAAITGACVEVSQNYAFEVHITRVWGANEEIPLEIAEEF